MMAVADTNDLQTYCLDTARRAKAAAAQLARCSGEQKNQWLRDSAEAMFTDHKPIQVANEKDLAAAPGYGLTDAQVDRLRLTKERIEDITAALLDISRLVDPIGEVIDSSVRPNGLQITKVRAPLGVVFFIYESRPNVTADAAAICAKSGNAVILRGGKEAAHSSWAIVEVLREQLVRNGLPVDAVQLVETTDRAAVGEFLALSDLIDVAIPRGGEGLIRRVTAEATMPVIKHYAGNCHVYLDASADPAMAEAISVNSKCHRLGVCNACESLVVHSAVADELLPRVGKALAGHGIEIRGDQRAQGLITGAIAATEGDFSAEFLGPVISVKVVDSLDEAITHINHYSSGHTETIVTNDLNAARQFTLRIDSSAVMVNASTRFNDGGEFGLGAEIGISTDKFHARGPCGLRELTTYKYIVYGDGHVRQ
jgi:glutamate-5-semialdehyde dehydrogenase